MRSIEIEIIIFVTLTLFCTVSWADINEELIQTAKDGNLTDVERLLEAGADVNWKDWYSGDTVLMMAIEKGYTEIVELLKAAGAVE